MMVRANRTLPEFPLSFYATIVMVLILLNVGWDRFSPAHAQAVGYNEVCCDGAFSYTQWQPSIERSSVPHNTMLDGERLLLTQTNTEGNQEPVSLPSEGSSSTPQAVNSETSRYRRLALAVALGAAYWPDVHRVEPNPAIFNPDAVGRPNLWGISVELAGHVRVYTRERWDLLLGTDLGFVNMENSKSFATPGTTPGAEKSRLLTQLIYITPGAKLYYHTDIVRPFVGAGIGGYFLELAARTERGALIEKFVKKQSFGGYVSVGIDLPIRIGGFGLLLRLEDKLHFADFGSLGNFSPGSGSLTGPINTIHVGFGLVL